MPTKASSNAKSAPVPIPASKKLKQAKGGKVVLADINTILFRKNVLEMMQFTPEGRDEEITVRASRVSFSQSYNSHLLIFVAYDLF